MIYKKLINFIKHYGASNNDICQSAFKCDINQISEKTIIAPTWSCDIFEPYVNNIKHI